MIKILSHPDCHRLVAWLCCVLCCAMPLGFAWAAEKSPAPFRIGFTSAMFTNVNENDVRAAIRIWGAQIGKARNIPVDPDPLLFRNIEGMLLALEQGRVDAVGMLTLEYHRLRRDMDFSPIYLNHHHTEGWTEEYLVLAHRDGPVKSLADLGGRRLTVHDNPRASLAPLWLDTLLHNQGYPTSIRFAARVETNTKLSQVILPVFFQQMDACLVTRNGFATMSELNPQLARQLVVLAGSPAVIPTLFAFRSDDHSPYKADVIAGLNELLNSPAGRQVLAIFQTGDIVEKPTSILDASLDLIEIYEQISREISSP